MALKFSAWDPDYSDYIRRLLDNNARLKMLVDSSSEDIDDSDNEPDFVLPATAEGSESSEVDSSEEDDDELLVKDVDEETM